MTAARSWAAANINAVSPRPDSWAFTSAPCSMSADTAAAEPDEAASMSAVAPRVVSAWTLAPASSNALTTSA